MINVDWLTFKSLVTAQSLPFKYVTLDSTYYMYTENASPIACHVTITTPTSSDQSDFETNLKPKGNRSTAVTLTPFADKVLPNGKRLFTRVHGTSANVAGAPDTIDFEIPYTMCKLTGIDIINGELGDKINLKILDTVTGTVSGVPNMVLNQFAYNVNIASSFHKFESRYDADMIQGLRIRVEYDAVTPDLLPKTIYVNFYLHEVKD